MMLKRWLLAGGLAVIELAVFQCIVAARETPGSVDPGEVRVSDVVIQGTKRMSIEQIKVHLRTQRGRKFDPSALDDDVRDLYKTQQFSNIQTLLQEDGPGRVKIFLNFRDLPSSVQKVTFQGAKHIKEEELCSITGVRPGMPLNPNLNRQGCQRILEKYEEMGRPSSRCTLVKGGKVDDTEVVYEITEGPKLKVRDTQFVGNSRIKGERLAEMMHSSPAIRLGQILITGNKHTSSASILAHLPLYPGRLLSDADLREAEKTLAELGLFVVDPLTGVHPTVTILDPDSPGAEKDILITVREKPADDKSH
jgi:outer membrane protein assembly factor BamA